MKNDGCDDWNDEEKTLIIQRKPLEAIKRYRNRTGCTLVQAKNSYDRLTRAGKKCKACDGHGWIADTQ
jgi:ribosomal protein L7/L12